MAVTRGNRRAGKMEWQLIVNSYPCPACGAGPGRACVSTGNRAKYEPHAERAGRAHVRGWAFADQPAKCVRCHGPLPAGNNEWPKRCIRCAIREDGPAPTHATADNPGPDGSYDVPLDGMEE